MTRKNTTYLAALTLAASLTAGFPAVASERDDSTGSDAAFGVMAHSMLWQSRRAAFFAGPASACFRYRTDLTELRADGTLQEGDGDYAVQLGTDPRRIGFEASTYTLHSSHTLTGRALYSIGRTDGVTLNENADPLTVYPYLTADSTGGGMTAERYLFEGGYADHRGRIFWGVEGGYEAGLSYRMTDPRPRNITGRLTANAGIGLTAGHYGVALSAMYRRYTQTSELMFKDDTGGEKTYQMTGLGTVYNRFTGMGLKSNFRGNTFAVTAELIPLGETGFSVEAVMTRFNLTKLLADLNSLPLARVWENRLDAKAGYISGTGPLRWIAEAGITAVRRHGIENIFGDATLSSYPLIDALEMYADNRLAVRAGGTVEWAMRRGQSVGAQVGCIHARRTEVYAYPRIEEKTSETSLHVTLRYDGAFAHGWTVSVMPWGIADRHLSGGLRLAVGKRAGSRFTVGLTGGVGVDRPRLADFDSGAPVSGKALCAEAGVFAAF